METEPNTVNVICQSDLPRHEHPTNQVLDIDRYLPLPGRRRGAPGGSRDDDVHRSSAGGPGYVGRGNRSPDKRGLYDPLTMTRGQDGFSWSDSPERKAHSHKVQKQPLIIVLGAS
jgi:hypothetical protein